MRRLLLGLLLGAVSPCQAAAEFKLSAAPGPHAVGVRTVHIWGYNLLREDKDKESIEVFKLNTIMYPDSGNTYDSLAEAYEKAKMNELAIKDFKRSLELDPRNANAVKQLKTLGAGM